MVSGKKDRFLISFGRVLMSSSRPCTPSIDYLHLSRQGVARQSNCQFIRDVESTETVVSLHSEVRQW